jgi:GTP pyrophosphokinase
MLELAQRHGRGSVEDLFAWVATGGSRRPRSCASCRAARAARAEPAPRGGCSAAREGGTSGAPGRGKSDVMVRFGGCCAPLPGDEVVGFVTRGRGVTVHLKDCPKVFELDPERRIDVDWQPGADKRGHAQDPHARALAGSARPAREGDEDDLAEGVNIGAAIVTTSPDRLSEQTFDVWVHDVAKLNSVMKEIRKIKGVLSVERLRV